MTVLTVFILPTSGPKKSIKRLMDSFGTVSCIFVILASVEAMLEHEINTEWYCFLHDNEWLELELSEALPTFLEANIWDYYLVHKKVNIDGQIKFFIAPRIFRNNVRLKLSDLTPTDVYLSNERILNGWILEEDRIA
jgi:hypothetical protein